MVFAVDEISALLMETGYRKPVTFLTLRDKPGLRAALMDYHCMLKAKAAMDQFAEGLQTLKAQDLIQKFPLLTKQFFISNGKKITAREYVFHMLQGFTIEIYIVSNSISYLFNTEGTVEYIIMCIIHCDYEMQMSSKAWSKFSSVRKVQTCGR